MELYHLAQYPSAKLRVYFLTSPKLQSPLPRIPLQSGRLLGWHPGARPSHPTPSTQRPKPQGPQFFQPRRTDPARRAPATQLQYRWSPPRRPTATPLPILSRHPIPTTRPSAPSPPPLSRQLARRRHLGVIKRVLGTYRYYLTRAGRAAIAAGRRLTEHTIIPALA